ncbi:MAG: hypothetical protein Q8933_09250 [Bacteroidota bacterium]|nr:hypothetical protein [Bacteroidota bacterium]
MFDISAVNKRYFTIKIENITLEVEPPKVKALKEIVALAKSKGEDVMDNYARAVEMILNKNKSNYKVPETLIDELDFDQLNEIVTAYFGWLGEQRNSKN